MDELQDIVLRCSQVPCWLLWEDRRVQEESWVTVCEESWKQVEGGNVGRFRIDLEGRADSMADTLREDLRTRSCWQLR